MALRTSTLNPAEDTTWGESLSKLGSDSHWYQAPSFLRDPPNLWPETPLPDEDELPCFLTCFTTSLPASPQATDISQYKTFDELLESRAWHGAAGNSPSVDGYRMAEINALRQAQEECFPSELQLKTGKSLSRSSRLKTLTPKLDNETQLIRVGDRLRCSPYLDPGAIHPIALDPKHPVSKLLIWH